MTDPSGESQHDNEARSAAGKVQQDPAENPHWLPAKKALGWAAGIVAVIIGGVGTVYFSGLISPATTPPEPKGPPALITVGNVDSVAPTVVFPKPISLTRSQLMELNDADGASGNYYARWFASRDPAFQGSVDIQLVAQGNRRNVVRIINIVPVEQCSRPLIGTLFYAPSQGANTAARLNLDLDNPGTPAAFMQGSSLKPDYFGTYSVSLQYGKQYTFQITAATSRHYCQFNLRATVIDNGTTRQETITDHGQPFRVTSYPSTTKPTGRGAFAAYDDLYLGGSASETVTGGKANKFGNWLWVKANPRTYNPG